MSWNYWSTKEVRLLKRLWPIAPLPEILAAIPRHSYNAIRYVASNLGVRRKVSRFINVDY